MCLILVPQGHIFEGIKNIYVQCNAFFFYCAKGFQRENTDLIFQHKFLLQKLNIKYLNITC